jgi:hypothetical protein
MKITCLLFLTMSCIPLMMGTSDAAAFQQPSPHRTTAGSFTNRRASDKNHLRNRQGPTTANHPKQLPNTRKSSAPGNVASLHQQDLAKSGRATQGKLTPDGAVGVVRPTETSLNATLNHVRHRGPNPPVVSGTAVSDRRNMGTINGTRMNHRN